MAFVLDALLEAQGQRLQRVLDTHQRFTRIVLAGGGAPEIAATLHALLGCPVAVVDAGGRPTVVVPSDAAAGADVGATSGVRQAILAGDHKYGEIVALTDGAVLDDDQRMALEQASMAIAVRPGACERCGRSAGTIRGHLARGTDRRPRRRRRRRC